MRIYEGSPRQDWEEVLRSVGAYLDDRGMRDIVFVEHDTGFVLQGLVVEGSSSSWGESMGVQKRITVMVNDEEVAGFMDDAIKRRGQGPDDDPQKYEPQLRVIGRFIDGERPRDVFFFEQGGSYVLRLSHPGQTGTKHDIFEFTSEDVAALIASAPSLRRGSGKSQPSGDSVPAGG